MIATSPADNLEPILRASILLNEEKKMHANGNGVASVLAPAPLATAITSAATITGNSTAPEVYKAINKISKVLSRDGISKGRQNEAQGYGFRGIDDVMNSLSALLAGAELLILPRMKSRLTEERLSASNKPLFFVTVEADFDFVSAADGSKHTVTMFGEAMDSADKATNKAMSAAYKYAALQVFCIPTEGMADADQATPEPQAKITQPRPVSVPTQHPKGHAKEMQYVNERLREITERKPESKPPVREKQPAPWTNRGGMRESFARIRERVGETLYLATLAKYGGNINLAWQSLNGRTPSENAQACFEELVELAVA